MKEDPTGAVQSEHRRLAALMFTDIVGFSRQMGSNEARTLRLLEVHNDVIRQAVTVHHGQVIKTVGDAFLVDFPSVVNAVQCAQQIQAQLRAHNAEKEPGEQIHVRIGIHSGDIVQRDGDVFGDGVNIASRLQTLAEPDTICISRVVYQEVEKKLSLGTVVSLGQPKLKNIAQRFQVYVLLPEQPAGFRQRLQVQRLRLRRGRIARLARAALIIMGFLIGGGIVTVLVLWLAPFPVPQSVLHNQVALPLPDRPSIVVLPFVNMSGDPNQDYFSDGITEVLTSDLSRIASLFVIARNTAFTYKGKAVNVQDVGRELGVRYVLEGSVQRAGEQVRIVVQLIDTTTDAHLWSERFDRPLKDIFAVQDEVVQKIVTTLKLQLTLIEQGYIVRKYTDNLDAYDYVLRGIASFWRLTKEGNIQARQMVEKAVELDPQYAAAYAGLGWTYFYEWFFRWSPDPQNLERAFELAQRAITLDDSLPLAHSLLSFVYQQKEQPEQALAEGKRAIALNPNSADGYVGLAAVLNNMGRPEEALPLIERAMRLNPRYPAHYLMVLGWTYRLTGRYLEAIAVMKEALSRNPNNSPAILAQADSYVLQWASQQSTDPQMLEQAVAVAQQAIALNDGFWHHITLGYAYLWQKQYEQASTEMERVIALEPNRGGGYAGLAEVLSDVGRREEAIELVEKALRLGPLLMLGRTGTSTA